MAIEWRNKWRHGREVLSRYMPGTKIMVFDVETTGLKDDSKIIQFSACICRILEDLSLQNIESINFYVNPQEKLPEKIIEITGITDEILKDGESEIYAAEMIAKLFSSVDVISGYNVGFDISQVEKLSVRMGVRSFQKPSIDVCEMARDFVLRSDIKEYKLANVAAHFLKDKTFTFHDSFEDVKATVLLLEYFAKQYKDLGKEEGKIPMRLEKAHLFVNPRQKSMQRIYLLLNSGGDGDIFYDIAGHYWSCKSTPAAKRLFKSADLCDLEDQIYRKYIYPFHYTGIDDMARGWLKFRREKAKERKSQS